MFEKLNGNDTTDTTEEEFGLDALAIETPNSEENPIEEKASESKDTSDLSEAGLEFLKLEEVNVDEVMMIDINPRDKVDDGVVKRLKELDSEDLQPINLGYTEENLIINGHEVKGRFFLVDGEHRYTSREKGSKIKCKIKYYDNELEVRRDSVILNLHGQRLKDSELEEIIDLELDTHYRDVSFDFEQQVNISDLSKRYAMSRSFIRRLMYRYILKIKTMTSTSHSKKYTTISKSNIQIMRNLITDLSKVELEMFLDNFGKVIENCNSHDTDKVKEIVSLYTEGKIKTYIDYADLKAEQKKAKEKESETNSHLLEEPSPEKKSVDKDDIVVKEQPILSSEHKLDLNIFTSKIQEFVDGRTSFLKNFIGDTSKSKEISEISEETLEELKLATEGLMKIIKKASKNSKKVG